MLNYGITFLVCIDDDNAIPSPVLDEIINRIYQLMTWEEVDQRVRRGRLLRLLPSEHPIIVDNIDERNLHLRNWDSITILDTCEDKLRKWALM